MNLTNYLLAGKKLPSLSVGTMRWGEKEGESSAYENVKKIIAECIKYGAVFLDTSPMYCYKSEEENSERWTGYGIKNLRDKVILSAKCSPGNGGTEIGEYNPRGFSCQTAELVREQMDSSLNRLGADHLDCYSMWSVTSDLVYDSAFKKGGWMDGAMKAKDEGLFKHLGITGHPDVKLMNRWTDDGIFDLMTIPFNILDISRLDGIKHALEKGIAVIAMNPLAGGMLGGNSEIFEKVLKDADAGVSTPAEMALKFVEAFGVSCLAGFSDVSQVKLDADILSTTKWSVEKAMKIRDSIMELLGNSDDFCTGCGYCKPCPEDIAVPDILRLRNYYKILNLESAKWEMQGKNKWDDKFKPEKCVQCGICESRCPNSLPVMNLLEEAVSIIRE